MSLKSVERVGRDRLGEGAVWGALRGERLRMDMPAPASTALFEVEAGVRVFHRRVSPVDDVAIAIVLAAGQRRG